MTLTQALIGFAGIAFLITIIPATDTALVLRSLVAGGRRSAYACVFGITAGLLIWGVTAATGLAVLMAAAPLIFDLITVAGGLYLIYLGIKFLLNLRRWGQVTALKTDQAALASLPAPAASLPGVSGADAPTPASEHRVGKDFLAGFIANILNPKIAVFYIASVPPFMVASVQPFIMGSLLALIHGGINVLWFTLIISLASLAMKWLLHPRATLVIDGIAGSVLLVFGVLILVEAANKLL
ncbi:MAG TPA: LysE family translocator [Candidatus Rothia avistercoris]|uniref:LysE family translocator n=1 Tax=Candidatus Rothia avistercoris TaxID=2840479 RepID=A0A9D2UF46_9MICC|nr:LysE family translocator [Candidatus Rothia avistercoris]